MPPQGIKVNGNMGLDFIWTQKWACPSLNRRRDLTLRAQGFHSGARSLWSEFQPVTSFWEPLPRKWGIDFSGLVSLLGRQSRFRETLGNPQDVLFLLESVRSWLLITAKCDFMPVIAMRARLHIRGRIIT
jgi:hypothetical protein